MDNSTYKLLYQIAKYIGEFPGSVQAAYHSSGPELVSRILTGDSSRLILCKPAGSYLFHMLQPLRCIYILLEGSCCVEKYSHLGHLFTDSHRKPIQIFGLIEAITEQRFHTVSMRCMSNCTYARIPLEDYLAIMDKEPDIMRMSMQYLCVFFKDHIQTTDHLLLDSPRRSILFKLYSYCVDQPFPVTVMLKKEELAQDLNMNLRTLYRHLDSLYQEGLLSSRKGKITVTREQYLTIEKELRSLTEDSGS